MSLPLTMHSPLHSPSCCSKEDCPKNHIQHYEVVVQNHDGSTTTTKGATFHFVHHKNERRLGPAIIPVAPETVEVLALLEQASKHLAPDCPTLWFNQTLDPYTTDYWSQAGAKALSMGNTHCTARDMRHEFSTKWRDFMGSVTGQLLDIMATHLEGAAAFMMGNTSAAWDATYDDNIRSRAKERVLKLYPKFQEFVKREAAMQRQHRSRNPLT